MRRTPRASASRLFGRACAVPATLGVLVATAFPTSGGIAAAEPGSPDTIGSLVAAIANVNQKLQELGANIQAQQESVNKAIVDVQSARDHAAAAQLDVDASRRAVDDSNAAIKSAQQRFDTFAASTYVNGPSTPPLPGRRWPPAHNRLWPIYSGPAPSRSTRSPRRDWPSRRPTRPRWMRRPARTRRCRR